jgi:hypothetical protein
VQSALFKSKASMLSALFALLSAGLFLIAVGAVVYLPVYGMYVALTLIFFGGFFMLTAAMIREKSKTATYQRLIHSSKASEDEEDETLDVVE